MFKKLEAGSTPEHAADWLRDLIRMFGPGFHLDTPGADYIDVYGHRLAESDVNSLDVSVGIVFAVLGADRPYEIGEAEVWNHLPRRNDRGS